MKIKWLALLTAILMVLSFTACSASPKEVTSSNVSSQSMPTKDREGNPIKLPAKINRIISDGPSNTEILTGLGVAGKLVAVDTYSADVSGISKDLPKMDLYKPDAEKILTYKPDVIIVTGMSQSQGTDPFKALKDAGVCIIYIPSSNSLQGIMDDISYLANLTGTTTKGDAMIAEMKTQIAKIKAIGSKITSKKKVYFEIDPTPYSFGSGVFLDEILKDIGAVNILESQKSWVKVSAEDVVEANPDVILTNVNFKPDPIGDIKKRKGWEDIAAVMDNQVFSIDANTSSRASQNVVKAILQIAKTVYPIEYKAE
jgi:iron complex transport system substrate-binding protein